MDLSIIIPLYNEAESLPELKAWIDRSLQGFTYELIFVDDGSTDGSWEEISRLASLARNDNYFNSRNFSMEIFLFWRVISSRTRAMAALSSHCSSRRRYWFWS